MRDLYPGAVLRHPIPERPQHMSRQDYAIQLVLLFGRHVQVRRLHGRLGWLECVMFCRDPEDRMFFEVSAEVAPNGAIRTHGGNWIWGKSSPTELIDLFSRNADIAYARGAAV